MFLTLLKRALKGALHDAVDEWAFETGLPEAVIQEMRAQRERLAAQMEAQADRRAALALGVDDDEEEDAPRPLALPMPSAARITCPDSCPAPDAGEECLLGWVHGQREKNVSWAEVGHRASEAGHAIGDDTLRMRYRRWKEKTPQNGDDSNSPAS
jgi:hypothetical protein